MMSKRYNLAKLCFFFLLVIPLTLDAAEDNYSSIIGSCDVTIADNESIQDAIDSAASETVICIESGTFNEDLEIHSKHLVLQAADDNAEPVLVGGSTGILIFESDSTIISGLTIKDFNSDGVKVENSSGVEIRNNYLTNNGNAISAEQAPGLVIAENDLIDQRLAFRQGFGIEISESDSVLIENNVINENTADAIRLMQSRHATIQNNEMKDNWDAGVYLFQSDTTSVTGNTMAGNFDYGVHLEESVEVLVENNSIDDHGQYGILLEEFSNRASLLNNTLSGHDVDIMLIESAHATINDNVMGKGLVIDPNNIRSDFEAGQTHYNHTMENNTVNGGELFYGKNVTASEVPNDAQQVIIHNSDNLSLSDMTFSDVAIGLQVSYSQHVTLTNIKAENHVLAGARLVVCNGAKVEDSEFNNNGTDGLFLESSHNSMVTNTSAANNQDRGMVYFWSEDSIFDENTATGNGEIGIYHWNSHDGIVRHNMATENGTGISVSRSNRTVAVNNTANENTGTGLSVGIVRNPEINNNTTMYNGGNGISTGSLEWTGSISGNVSTHNEGNGIRVATFMTSSSNITIENNTFSQNEKNGVEFARSEDVTLTANMIEENLEHGIFIGNSDNLSIEENTIANNGMDGIYMNNRFNDRSSIEGNTVVGHTVDLYMNDLRNTQRIVNNDFGTGILIIGEESESYFQTINDNTVKGKELFYSRLDDVPEIPEDPGQIIIYSGGYIEIEDLNFENVAAGIQVGYSDTLIVSNTTFTNTQVGVNTTDTELTTIEDNTFANNVTGVKLQGEFVPVHFENNEFLANTIGLDADNLSPTADARNNWWGDESGPSGGIEDPESGVIADGSGDLINGSVQFDPWIGAGTEPQLPFFAVQIDSTNSPVEENETLIAYATIENTGDAAGTQSIELLRYDDSVLDSNNLTLDIGEEEAIMLTWITNEGDAGTGEITVKSEDDESTISVYIQVQLDEFEIAECAVIDSPGKYILQNDIAGEDTCIDIRSGDVIFDGNGHTITGIDSDVSFPRGIQVDGDGTTLSNVTIKNVSVENWTFGVGFNDVEESLITEVTATENGNGINLRTVTGVTVDDVILHNNSRGLNVTAAQGEWSDNNTFTKITASGNSQAGVYAARGTGNSYSDLTLTDNDDGLYLIAAANENTFSNIVAENNNYGINLRNTSSQNSFDEITIKNNNRYGIWVYQSDDNNFSNLTLTENKWSNIRITGDLQFETPVTGNQFEEVLSVGSSEHGISMSVAADNQFSKITFENNEKQGLNLGSRNNGNAFNDVTAIGNTEHGISINYNSNNNSFTDLTLSDNGTESYHFSLQVAEESYDNVFENVTINGGTNGISIRTENTVFDGGSVVETSGDGLRLWQNASSNSFSNMTLSENAFDFTTMDGATDNHLKHMIIGNTELSLKAEDVHVNGADAPANLPENSEPLNRYVEIVGITDDAVVEFLHIYYDDSDVQALDEEDLSVWRYDEGSWSGSAEMNYSSGVDTEEQYVFAENITEFSIFGVFSGDLSTSIVEGEVPLEMTLKQNYPNPFNPTTQIRYSLPEISIVLIEVYNAIGQRVAVLVNEQQQRGWHEIEFDASALSSGIYIYRLQTGSDVKTSQMTLIK